MTTLQTAKDKIATADVACSKAQEHWHKAASELGGSVSVNGYGIFNNPLEIRTQLSTAQAHITRALQELASVDWPTNADYDQL